MPWGDASWSTVEYPHGLETTIEHCKSAIASFGALEDEADLGVDPNSGASFYRIRGHFRYGLKRFGQKTRVHIYVLGHSDQPNTIVGVESQGGDVWGTASKAGRSRFLEALGAQGDFEILEDFHGPPIR